MNSTVPTQIDVDRPPTPVNAPHDTPLAPTALYEQVAERLREQIYARQLEPGSWIDEQKLAGEYGISRTPLREALKVLATEGLVTMKVRRGAYVTEMSEDDVRQIYRMLALLESDAAAELAGTLGPTDLAALEAQHALLEATVTLRDEFFRHNEKFHLLVLSLAGNRWRLQIVNDLRKMMKLNRHHSLFKQGRLSESLQEHRAIMQALRDHDGPAAAALMQQHFQRGLTAATA